MTCTYGERVTREKKETKGKHGSCDGLHACVCVALRVLDGVFAFLQLGDVQLGLGAVQSFEPHLIVVDIGDDGTTKHTDTHTEVSTQSIIYFHIGFFEFGLFFFRNQLFDHCFLQNFKKAEKNHSEIK